MNTSLSILDELLQTKKFLSENQTKDIFLFALHKYFTKMIEVQTLESVAIFLYYEWNKPFIIETQFKDDFAHLLLATTELNHEYTRLQENKRNIFADIEIKLKAFYEKNFEFQK